MKKNSLYIILSLILFSSLTTLTDAYIHPNYFIKIGVKVIIFILIPLIYYINFKKDRKEFKKIFKFNNKNIIKSITIGLLIYLITLIGFTLIKKYGYFDEVINNLNKNMSITKNNFIYVSLYISLLNSFLEEILYRGLGYYMLNKYIKNKYIIIFSPLLFSFYHLGMIINMFNIYIIVLILLLLFIVGIIFNYLIKKYEDIYLVWIIHMFLNFAINTCTFILYGIL